MFSLTYAVVPAAAIGLAWWWHWHDRPALAWSLIGICVAVVAAQAFMVSEAVIAAQLWWPAFVLAVRGRWRAHAVAAWGVTTVVFLLHPLAGPLFVLLAGALWVRRHRVEAVVVLGSAAVRWLTLEPMETERIGSPLAMFSQGAPARTAAVLAIVLELGALVLRDAVPASVPT